MNRPFLCAFVAMALSNLIGCTVDPDKQDYDQDGILGIDDCDDTNPAVGPGAPEICDGLDNDCDGMIDDADDDVDLSTERTWYRDGDSDSFGTVDDAVVACRQPEAFVAIAGDCDDTSNTVHPNAAEVCNDGVDDDCNGFADDADPNVDVSTGGVTYRDRDQDGFGDETSPVAACTPPADTVDNILDCDDFDSAVHPEATEVCNEIDDNCDQLIDDDDKGVDVSTGTEFSRDRDGDGYGAIDDGVVMACDVPDGYAELAGDCATFNRNIHPGATEICNSLDDDCNGLTDDDDPLLDLTTGSEYFLDEDGDSFGTDVSVMACSQPFGFIFRDGDCDDTMSWVNPGEPERCNFVDDDCNPATLEEGVALNEQDSVFWDDVTSAFELGTAATPVSLTFGDDVDLYVCAGTYYVRLNAERNLTIIAPDGPSVTAIDGGVPSNSDTDPLITIERYEDLSIEDITLQNAGSGIDAPASDVTLSNVVMTEIVGESLDSTTDSYGIRHALGTLTLTDVTFEDHDVDQVLSSEYSTVSMERTTWLDNDVLDMVVFKDAVVDGDDLEWRRNSAFDFVFSHTGDSSFDYDGVTATDNDGWFGGALHAVDIDGVIKNATFSSNTAGSSGGAIVGAGDLTIESSTFDGNAAPTGGAVRWNGGGELILDDVEFSSNSATVAGGGVYIGGYSYDSQTCDWTDVDFEGNDSPLGGGAYANNADLTVLRGTFDDNEGEDGVGLYFIVGTLDLEDVSFIDNRTTAAGSLGGGFLISQATSLTATDVTATNNLADYGGAGFVSSTGGTFDNATFENNSAWLYGGAVYVQSSTHDLEFDNSSLSNNDAFIGGAVRQFNADVSFDQTVVSGNDADEGAALATAGTSTVSCVGSTKGTYGFVGNVGTSASSGAIYMSQTSNEVAVDVFTGNSTTVDAVDCDFGTSAGANDNSPNDIADYTLVYDCVTNAPSCTFVSSSTTHSNYGDDATFCMGPACP